MKHPDYFLLIVRGTRFDLTRLNFSFAGYRFVPLDNSQVDDYLLTLGTTTNQQRDLLQEIRDEYNPGARRHDPHYAVLPLYPEVATWNRAMRCVWLLSIIYPSDFQCLYDIRYGRTKEGQLVAGMMHKYDHRESFRPLHVPEPEVNVLNEFLPLVFERFGGQGYISNVVDLYLQSYQGSLPYHRYLSLAMAMETLLDGTHEITYRLRRTVAVLLGRTPDGCDRLFKLVGILYGLRSTIVHGESFDREKVSHYLPIMEGLVSRLLIELLIHNIPDRKTLGDLVTRAGFGDACKLSSDYKEYRLNYDTYSLLLGGAAEYRKP